jgi:hypothetical protein
MKSALKKGGPAAKIPYDATNLMGLLGQSLGGTPTTTPSNPIMLRG